MHIFISMPMKDKTKEEILKGFHETVEYLQKKLGILPDGKTLFFCGYLGEEVRVKHESAWYLGESIKRLSDCDAAYFTEGWEERRGCRLERLVCEEYDIRIIDYKDI